MDDAERHIKHIYTKLQVEKRCPYKDRTHTELEKLNSIEYEKIFLIEGGLVRCLISCGIEGVGKIACDWAVGSIGVILTLQFLHRTIGLCTLVFIFAQYEHRERIKLTSLVLF